MSLIKVKKIKGVDCNYWKIVDCNVKTGFVAIAPFVDQQSAMSVDNMMDGKECFQIDFPVDVTNPLSYAYTKIKESRKGIIVVSEAVQEMKDPSGNIVQEYVPAVTEEAETNWFADAING